MLVLLYYLDWNALHGLSGADCDGLRFGRSEEHTSELQSQ